MAVDPWIEWTNFRGFRATGRVSLRPITIVLGPNNSGKSSLYKPLLLMQQTAATNRARPGLVTRGDVINAGGFEDLVPLGDSNTTIGFKLGLHTHKRRRSTKHVGHYPPGELSLEFVKGEAGDDVSLQRVVVSDIYGRQMFTRVRDDAGDFSYRLHVETPEGDKATDFDRAVRREIRQSKPEHFLFSGASAFSEALTALEHKDDEEDHPLSSGIELTSRTVQYLKAADFIYDKTKEFLTALHYLGPLREFPKRVYELSGETPASVGVRGENAPELLFRGEQSGLRDTVNSQLRRFGFDADLQAHEVSGGLFELGLARRGWSKPINIADLGFGVSQLLPLVVQGLLLGKGDYLVAEQPEIHLNPQLQGRLADFFVDLAADGRRVIAETHSEHLLLRLRRRIADGGIDSSDVGLYFVEMEDGESRVREVPIDELGHIDGADWPKGFFEEALGESMALAAEQSKRRADAG